MNKKLNLTLEEDDKTDEGKSNENIEQEFQNFMQNMNKDPKMNKAFNEM